MNQLSVAMPVSRRSMMYAKPVDGRYRPGVSTPVPYQSPRNGTSPGIPKKKLSSAPRFHSPVAGSTNPTSSGVPAAPAATAGTNANVTMAAAVSRFRMISLPGCPP
jgi:hypothetical protein